MLSRMKFEFDELIEQILDQLPKSVWTSKTSTFFDPAIGGGQFVRAIEQRLRTSGHDDTNIRNRVFGFEESNLHVRFAVNKYKLVGQYCRKPYDRFLKMSDAMKFDVCVGNPPYQDSDNDKKMLWNAFADKAIETTKKEGYIAMITPATWIRAKTNIHNSYRLLEELQVKKAVVYAKDDTPFSGVGSTISYHITENVKRSNPTPIYYGEWSKRKEQFIRNVNIKKEKIWPGELTPENLTIHDKLFPLPKIEFVKSCEFHNQKLKGKKLVSDIQTSEFPYTHHVSAAITRYTSEKFSRYEDWKVMVPLTSTIDKAVIDKNCGHGEDMLTLYVSDQTIAENIKHLFQTEVYKFIGRMYKNGRNQVLQNIFPIVSFDKKWTSDELYDLFGFTLEEREYARNYR
jgi:hypothetical protein